MFNFLGKLFGAEKALTGIVNGASRALDALVHTDEEKERAAAEQRSEARRMVVDWMRATQGQNLARRLIALTITATWLVMYITASLTSMLAVWRVQDTEKLLACAEIARDLANDMNPAVMLILAFYFAAPHMGEIAKTAIERMKTHPGPPLSGRENQL